MDEFNSYEEHDDFADHKLMESLQETMGEEFAPASLGLLPRVFRLISIDIRQEGARNVRCFATLFHEKAGLRVSWVASKPDARLKAGELVSPRWLGRASCRDGALMISRLVPMGRPEQWENLFHTVPHSWVGDRELVRRAAKLMDALPLYYRHLFNGIFWSGERFKQFCTLQLFKYGHHAESEGCLNHAVAAAEHMREVGKANGNASVSLCILLGLLHDAGKAGEYYRSEDGGWSPTIRGRLLWHRAIILDWISEVRARWNVQIPENLYMALIHCLVSSSHMPEWMGAKEPQMPEARLLSEMERPSGTEAALRRLAVRDDQMMHQPILKGVQDLVHRVRKEGGLDKKL